MHKWIAVILSCAMLFAAAGCGKSSPVYNAGDDIKNSVRVKLVVKNSQDILFDDTVTIKNASAPTAAMAIIAGLDANDIAYTFKHGEFDNIAGAASDDENGWACYINSVKPAKSSDLQTVKENDIIQLQYLTAVAAK